MSLLAKIWFSSLIWFPVLGIFLGFSSAGDPIAQLWGVAYLSSIAYYIGKGVGVSKQKQE